MEGVPIESVNPRANATVPARNGNHSAHSGIYVVVFALIMMLECMPHRFHERYSLLGVQIQVKRQRPEIFNVPFRRRSITIVLLDFFQLCK